GAVLGEIDSSHRVVVTNHRLDANISTDVNPSGSFRAIRLQSIQGDHLSMTLYRDEQPVSAPEDLLVPETTGPVVLDSKPTNGEKDIIIDAVIQVYFSEPIETASVNPNSFYLTDSLGVPVPGAIGFMDGNTTAYLDPHNPLAYASRYNIVVTREVEDLQGLHLDSDYTATFTTTPPILNGNYINVPADVPTIQAGIDSAINGDTVLVQPGTYVENINFSGKNIVVGSLTLITGDTSYISQTVIDGSQPSNLDSGSVVYFGVDTTDTTDFSPGEATLSVLNGFKITGGSGTWVPNQTRGGGILLDNNSNPVLTNLIISDNIAVSCNGAGIYCGNNSNPYIENVRIIGNNGSGSATTIDGSGGIYLVSSSPTLKDVEIVNNIGLISGGLFCHSNSNPVLTNVTIAGNNAMASPNNNVIGGLISSQGSNPTLINTIIWNNSPKEIVVRDNSVTIAYSDIQEGLDSIDTYNNAVVYWLAGNIDSNPMFLDTANGDYRLQAGSPCIDAGIQDTMIIYNSGQNMLTVPSMNFVGTAPDMGAYEFGATERMEVKQKTGLISRRKKETLFDDR
ncbi:MAG: Ig-like domain-containing protein, partial [bacterium]